MGLIRFLLACIVVLCHTSALFGYASIPSNLAVQCFYVISGFYMSLILNSKYPKGSNKLFYKNRALKIYPIYWFILILLVGYGLLINRLGYPGTVWFYNYASPLSFPTWVFLIVANVLIIGLDLTFLLGIDHGKLYFTKNYMSSKPNVYLFGFNSIAWTVGVELLFYVIAPFIFRKRPALIILILSGSLFLRIWLAQKGLSGHPWDYMFFPTQLMFFMGGGISYYIYLWLQKKPVNNRLLKLQYVFLVIMLLLYSYLFPDSYFKQAVLFVAFVLFMPASFILSKNNRLDRYLGNLSYPIYISQMFVINITRANAFPKIGGLGITTLLIVIVLSILLYHFIAQPIEKLRQKPFKKRALVL